MLDLSRLRSREIQHPLDIVIADYDRRLESQSMFRYLQFFLYIASNGEKRIEAVVLNSLDYPKRWWKKTIRQRYKSVKWLNNTYKVCKKMWIEEHNRLFADHGVGW